MARSCSARLKSVWPESTLSAVATTSQKVRSSWKLRDASAEICCLIRGLAARTSWRKPGWSAAAPTGESSCGAGVASRDNVLYLWVRPPRRPPDRWRPGGGHSGRHGGESLMGGQFAAGVDIPRPGGEVHQEVFGTPLSVEVFLSIFLYLVAWCDFKHEVAVSIAHWDRYI